VQDCYHEKYGRVFKPTEIKMMLTAFSNMETVHIAAYSHLLDTIGMPESEYGAFLEYAEMKEKHDYMQNFGVDSDEDIARTLAMFGGFTEGVQLFASFAMLMNFPRFNKMKGMGQIVTWSIRDESLHCEGIIKMFHTFCQERQCLTKAVKDDIADVCQTTIRLEDNFIDLAFEMGPVNGMTPKEIKKYIRYIADWRMGQLGLKPIYMIDEHPLPWLAPMLNGVEHANFFEQRATEYSKAATKGQWNDVWDSFDKRQKAKIIRPTEQDLGLLESGDMFSRAGVAAE
jgi:ribonucleoside-diphosphate reductase beta chain